MLDPNRTVNKKKLEGADFRQRRHRLGMTLRQLADLAGVSECALSYAERDMPDHYGSRAIEAIAAALATAEREVKAGLSDSDIKFLRRLRQAPAPVRAYAAAMIEERAIDDR